MGGHLPREATLWRWPAATPITFYHLTYTTAIGRDEEGASICEQASGWTKTDQLDATSYIRLEPTKPSRWREAPRPRDLKLDREHHLPVWERFIAASVEELPEALREEITVGFPHVVEVYSYDSVESDEGVCLLNEVNHPGDFESGPYAESIGWVPLPWIRELVEQTEHRRHQRR